ncbi:hypothetical protein [Paenibacillus pabuli]|uniref:hypothetical protein n=1 Tax=Paenibacillus pabuli TaxID=1472 RepID=UPI00078115B3|nr:hypothetical protein [Paenibacillus pabuli]MEC0123565.1 hypothetical protein [Paenibacillus pabuli]
MQTGILEDKENHQAGLCSCATQIREHGINEGNDDKQKMMNQSRMRSMRDYSFMSDRYGARPNLRANVWTRMSLGLIIMFSMSVIYYSSTVNAAGPELGVTAQKAWETVLSKADSQTKLSLQRAYENVGNWTTQEQAWEQKIKTLHTANTKDLEQLRMEIRQTDDAKIAGLIEKVKQTQTRYEPLFALYSSVNKQLDAAKAIKNKEWSAAIRTQADTLKPVVQLAREDLRLKKKELAEARKRKSTEVKRLRTILAGADQVKKQIQTGKKQASLSKERYSNALQQFKQNTKQGQSSRILSSLNSLAAAAEKWAGSKQHIYTLEQKVSATYAKVRQELTKRAK